MTLDVPFGEPSLKSWGAWPGFGHTVPHRHPARLGWGRGSCSRGQGWGHSLPEAHPGTLAWDFSWVFCPPLPPAPYLISSRAAHLPFLGVDTPLGTRGATGVQSAANGAGRRAAGAAGCGAWGGGRWSRRQAVSGQIPEEPAWRLPGECARRRARGGAGRRRMLRCETSRHPVTLKSGRDSRSGR